MTFDTNQYGLNVASASYNGQNSTAPAPNPNSFDTLVGKITVGETLTNFRLWVSPERDPGNPDDMVTTSTAGLGDAFNRVRLGYNSEALFDEILISDQEADVGIREGDNLVTQGVSGEVVQLSAEISAAPTTYQFDLAWTNPPQSGSEVVDLSPFTGDLEAVQISPVSVTFDATNYFIPQTITVTAQADADSSNDEVTVLISPDSGGSTVQSFLVVE